MKLLMNIPEVIQMKSDCSDVETQTCLLTDMREKVASPRWLSTESGCFKGGFKTYSQFYEGDFLWIIRPSNNIWSEVGCSKLEWVLVHRSWEIGYNVCSLEASLVR